MDDSLASAIKSVDLDSGSAEQWFEIVNNAYSQSPDDWDGFKATLTAAGSSYGSVVDTFLAELESNGRLDTVSAMAAMSPSDLATAHQELLHGTDEDEVGEDAEAVDDEALWSSVADTHGGAWAEWDGSEEGWAEYRAWFVEAAESVGEEARNAVEARLSTLDGASMAARVEQLTAWGLPITASVDDESLWSSVVAEHGSAWADWDGTEEGWTQYRTWFVEAAESVGVEARDAVESRLSTLDGESTAARVEQLTAWGLPVTASVDDEALWSSVASEHGEAWANWDGSEEGWAEYRAWFVETADSVGPEARDAVEARLVTLDGASTALRVAQLTAWGLPITVVADDEDAAGAEAAADPEQEELEDLVVSEVLTPVLEEIVSSDEIDLGDLNLDDPDVQEALQEVLQKVLGNA